MNNCKRCNGNKFGQVDEHTIVCMSCGVAYKINNNTSNFLIDLTKCEFCNLWYVKELENKCDCRKIG